MAKLAHGPSMLLLLLLPSLRRLRPPTLLPTLFRATDGVSSQCGGAREHALKLVLHPPARKRLTTTRTP